MAVQTKGSIEALWGHLLQGMGAVVMERERQEMQVALYIVNVWPLPLNDDMPHFGQPLVIATLPDI